MERVKGMAIDKNKTKELITETNDVIEFVSNPLPTEGKEFLKKAIMGPVFKEIQELIQDSRPPVLYIL